MHLKQHWYRHHWPQTDFERQPRSLKQRHSPCLQISLLLVVVADAESGRLSLSPVAALAAVSSLGASMVQVTVLRVTVVRVTVVLSPHHLQLPLDLDRTLAVALAVEVGQLDGSHLPVPEANAVTTAFNLL